MFHQIIFLLLIVSSLSYNFNRCAVCFQSFMNIAYRSTQEDFREDHFLGEQKEGSFIKKLFIFYSFYLLDSYNQSLK